MKLLVQTTGQFQLQDDVSRQLIRASGYTLVVKTSFVEWRTACGQLKIVAQVGDAATDDEWSAYVKECKGDLTLAVASFKSAFPIDERDTLPTDPTEAAVVKQQRAVAAAKKASAPAPGATGAPAATPMPTPTPSKKS
jgi:hypothetical protein